MKTAIKKCISCLAAVALLAVMLCGCAGETQTVIAQIESIDGNTVTATVGELSSAGGMGSGSQGESSAPTEGSSDAPSGTDGTTPPDMPSGEQGSAPTDLPEDAPSGTDGTTPPDVPGGEQGSAPTEGSSDALSGSDGTTPPAMPGSEQGGDSVGGMNMRTFTAGDETVTFTIKSSTEITVETSDGSEQATVDDLAVGDIIEVELTSSNKAVSVMVVDLSLAGSSSNSSGVDNGTAANTIDSDSEISGATYESSGDDENALRVTGATVTLDGITVTKSGGESSSTENGDFYGANAGLLAMDGATVTITDAEVNTAAVNGNGVFSYGSGTTVNISDSVIRTTEHNSGGIQTTGGGTMNATNLDVQTEGASSAAIRSDRGGGTVNVDGGSYVTNGTGSPAIYSTANISVSNAVLTANNSEAVVIEGQNSVSLSDCTVSGNMSGTYAEDNNENIHCIMIYQSMSGDAEVGSAAFSMDGGTLESLSGDMIYVTNTACTIALSDVELVYANDTLLRVEGNDSSRGWGTEGANGGDVIFTADAQTMAGKIVVDDISSLTMTMQNGSSFTGSINSDAQQGTVDVTIDAGSVWTLTADSYITSFSGDLSCVVSNGYHLYVNGQQAV